MAYPTCYYFRYNTAKLRHNALLHTTHLMRCNKTYTEQFNCHNVKKSNGDKRTCIQCGYYPNDRKENDEATPWMEAFVNARKWIEATK